MKKNIIGSKRVLQDEVQSTNQSLSVLTGWQTVVHGTVLTAGYQTTGKGHGRNSWESERGKNLLLSIYLEPGFLPTEKQFYLSKLAALAIRDTVKSLCPEVTVKWPNDIYVGNRKIAGILIETSIEQVSIKTAIVGIGLNVNQEHFSQELPNPGSLILETGKACDLTIMLDDLLDHMQEWYDRLSGMELDLINKTYLENLYKYQTETRFKDNDREFRARITGIMESGELVLETEEGQVEVYSFKEVEYL